MYMCMRVWERVIVSEIQCVQECVLQKECV